MTAIRKAIVIGGGIAGPVTALALHKAGIEAAVYEAYPSTADGVGGTLALAPNGLAALRIFGADEAVRAAATPINRTVMALGRSRIELPVLPDLPPLQVVHRSDLYRILHDLATRRGRRDHVRQAPGRRPERRRPASPRCSPTAPPPPAMCSSGPTASTPPCAG